MPSGVPWTRDQLLVAFRLYCRTPFGRLHGRNPEIIKLAGLLGRTPSAVAMKACNFASLDPAHRARQVTALANVAAADRALWAAFQQDSTAIAAEAEAAHVRLTGAEGPPATGERTEEWEPPDGPAEVERVVRVRRVQRFFAAAVLASYEFRCALSDLAVPALLDAGHIVPWSADPARRADPRNGILLNSLYHRAFDEGLITFDPTCRVVVSARLKATDPPVFHRQALLELEGRALRRPHRFAPDPAALAYHRERIFIP